MCFSNVDISLHILLTLMVTNCSAECPFSQLKRIKSLNRTTRRQEALDSLSMLMIGAGLLRRINIDDIIKHFARHNSIKRTLKCKFMFSLIDER